VQVVAVGILEFTLGEVFAGLRPAACYGAQLAVGVPLGLLVETAKLNAVDPLA
jgi:hypothetical protein